LNWDTAYVEKITFDDGGEVMVDRMSFEVLEEDKGGCPVVVRTKRWESEPCAFFLNLDKMKLRTVKEVSEQEARAQAEHSG
jgi:hypothetical protein